MTWHCRQRNNTCWCIRGVGHCKVLSRQTVCWQDTKGDMTMKPAGHKVRWETTKRYLERLGGMWLESKHKSRCAETGETINVGDHIFYDFKTSKAYCKNSEMYKRKEKVR